MVKKLNHAQTYEKKCFIHQRRSRDIHYELSVNLEEMYNESVRKLAVQNNVVCRKCDGNGRKFLNEKCRTCRGSGPSMTHQQTSTGMIWQVDDICFHCSGKDAIMTTTKACKKCNGKKTIRERFTIEVDIKRGMQHGQKIVYIGEGIQEPNKQPGDLVITLHQKKHPVFKRTNYDLAMVMVITKCEAQRGCQKTIGTLDNRKLCITRLSDEAVTLNTVLGEGMPIYQNKFAKGQLLIQYIID